MPLAHFITEAKKNTPVLQKAAVSVTETKVETPSQTPRTEVKRQMAVISEGDRFAAEERPPEPTWKTCQYLKSAGDRDLCKQYMAWCAKEKCQRKFMETDFFDFKKYVKQRKSIK